MKSQTTPVSPSVPKALLLASRPKTWIASLSPVFIGSCMAPSLHLDTFLLTLAFSLLIQIGANYANDYFDFINGADTHLRNGPKRATQQGWISPPAMKWATALIFGSALLLGTPLMLQAGWWSLGLALLCVLFGTLYTGGPKPLGYLGLGELLVFAFFGPVATCGSYFLQTGTVNEPVFIASLAPGFLSCAILIANNLRDESSDRIAQKRTMVVRFGRTFGAWEYTAALLLAAAVPWALVWFYGAKTSLLLSSLIGPLAIQQIKKAFSFRDPLELISLLPASAFLQIVYTLLFCAFA